MHKGLLALALLGAAPALGADIRSPEACVSAIATDPSAAREEAAVWTRLGGGTPAELCEAAALEALGAFASAATLLTRLGEDRNRAHPLGLRVTILEDAARLWLAADRPEVARRILDALDRITEQGSARIRLDARIAATEGDWPRALARLDTILATDPNDDVARAQKAAALRRAGDPDAALIEAHAVLARSPDQPEALFEAGAASAETGDTAAARVHWLHLITVHPDHALAASARRNVAALN